VKPAYLIHGLFATIDARRWKDLLKFFTDDVVYERPGYDALIGLSALEHFYREIRIVAAGEHRIEHIVASTNAAACWGRFVGAAHDGRALDERFADTYDLHNGRVARRTTYFFRPAI
jgi:ketosteroid isomerase-like protein